MDTSPPSHNPIVILNPTANRGKMQHHRALIRHRLEQEPQAEYVETTRQGEAQELARKAAEEGRPVIIVGGDGTRFYRSTREFRCRYRQRQILCQLIQCGTGC